MTVHCLLWGRANGPALKGIGARAIEAADRHFLEALFASTRMDEIAAAGWPEAAQAQFLAQQFDLQHRYYQAHYADADFWLLLRNGRPIGRLYWWAQGAQAALIDISLLPSERGRGIGTALLEGLTAQADRMGQDIRLHVEPFNPARRLYGRFGFKFVADHGIYARMVRPALVCTSEGAS